MGAATHPGVLAARLDAQFLQPPEKGRGELVG
jgi:hypothetical protein